MGSKNAIDDEIYWVETDLGYAVSNSATNDIQTYYSSEKDDLFSPATISLGNTNIRLSVIQPINSIEAPSEINPGGLLINTRSSDKTLEYPPLVLPQKTAEKIQIAKGYSNILDILGSPIEIKCATRQGNVTIAHFFINGVSIDGSDDPYYLRYGDFMIVSKETRQKFFGSSEAHFRANQSFFTLCSYIKEVEKIKATNNVNLDTCYSKYYTLNNGVFSPDYIDKVRSQPEKNKLNYFKYKIETFSLLSLFLLLFIWAFLFKSGSIKQLSKNDILLAWTSNKKHWDSFVVVMSAHSLFFLISFMALWLANGVKIGESFISFLSTGMISALAGAFVLSFFVLVALHHQNSVKHI